MCISFKGLPEELQTSPNGEILLMMEPGEIPWVRSSKGPRRKRPSSLLPPAKSPLLVGHRLWFLSVPWDPSFSECFLVATETPPPPPKKKRRQYSGQWIKWPTKEKKYASYTLQKPGGQNPFLMSLDDCWHGFLQHSSKVQLIAIAFASHPISTTIYLILHHYYIPSANQIGANLSIFFPLQLLPLSYLLLLLTVEVIQWKYNNTLDSLSHLFLRPKYKNALFSVPISSL